MSVVEIYTDGASSPHHSTGPGGYAALMFIDGKFVDGTYGGVLHATNNQMELAGVLAALMLVPLVTKAKCSQCGLLDVICKKDCEHVTGTLLRPKYGPAKIISDSKYCVNGATFWVHGWHQNGWKTATKQPVKNKDQWEEIRRLTLRTASTFHWVKGHAGNVGNEFADQWAGKGKSEIYKGSPAFVKKIPSTG